MFLFGWKLNTQMSPKLPIGLPAPRRADRERAVLDDAQLAPLGQRVQGVHVARQAREMRRHDRLRPRSDARFGGVDVDVARAGQHVDEHRRGADLDDHVRRGEERHRRRDHFVARTDAAHSQRDLERGGRRRHDAHRALRRRYADNAASNASTFGPLVIQPERSTSATSAIVAVVERGPRERQIGQAHRTTSVMTARPATRRATMKPMPSQRAAVTASPKR